jgi:hypothetical protein
VHLAGRVGRVGQLGSVLGDGGHVVSILREDDAGKMDELAATLGFEFVDIEATPDVIPRGEDGSLDVDNVDVEKMRRLLEDTMTLVDLAEDIGDDPTVVEATLVDDSDEEDDEDDGDEDSFQ